MANTAETKKQLQQPSRVKGKGPVAVQWLSGSHRAWRGLGSCHSTQFRTLLRQESNPAVFDAAHLLFNHN